jgi:hypothetical protein
MTGKFAFPVGIEEIYDLLTDPDFLVDRNIALGDVDSECETEETASGILVKMKRTRELDMPAFLSSVLGGNPVFRTEEQWTTVQDHYRGSSTTTVGSHPGSVHTSFTLSPDKKGCVYQISHEAKMKIPLVGRKVEQYIVKKAAEDVKKEMAYLRTRLRP